MMRLTASETKCTFLAERMKITGRVASGFGEGKKFFSLREYGAGFEKLLGTKPFFGTLNVDIGGENSSVSEEIKEGASLVVFGFESGGKKYFDVKCARARLCGVDGLLVFPRLNHHPKNILEFVCAQELRKTLGLEDGREVEIEI